jgi:hypothetical protein
LIDDLGLAIVVSKSRSDPQIKPGSGCPFGQSIERTHSGRLRQKAFLQGSEMP